MSKALLFIALLTLLSTTTAQSQASNQASASENDIRTVWSAWKSQNRRLYGSNIQEHLRFTIFTENYALIQEHNSQDNTAQLALNKFADLTSDEFKAKYTGLSPDMITQDGVTEQAVVDVEGLPESVDLRGQNLVTPVKNQGACGSCWAFSAVGVLEGHYALQNGNLVSFSEQQLIDCDTSFNQGCRGGWPYYALEYAVDNGVDLESDYPYTGNQGTCRNSGHRTAIIGEPVPVQYGDANALKNAISRQVVSVAVQANQYVFQFYSSGVLSSGCSYGINHAVLAVGYAKIDGVEAYIVKNSWGTSWGDEGYIYISTDPYANFGLGVCGILSTPVILE